MVLGGDRAAADAVHLRGAAEQPVAVEREAARAGRSHGPRDVADEVRPVDVARPSHRQPVRAELEARSRRAAGLVEVAGHLDGTLHAPADLVTLAALAAVGPA